MTKKCSICHETGCELYLNPGGIGSVCADCHDNQVSHMEFLDEQYEQYGSKERGYYPGVFDRY